MFSLRAGGGDHRVHAPVALALPAVPGAPGAHHHPPCPGLRRDIFLCIHICE